jgi:SAM-dependent methyltransferase
MSNTFSFSGFDIPINFLEMTGGGADTFEQISAGHISYIEKHIGITAEDTVLEIGCGIGRDAISLTNILSQNGNYLGIDIIGDSIEWCSNNIKAKYPNFHFLHFDIEDQLHNPAGSSKQEEFPIPLDDGGVGLIILWSVVTHLFEKDIQHYFQEFARVLSPRGMALVTCFIVDANILVEAKNVNVSPHNQRFEHEHSPGSYINDPLVPAGAVAFTYEKIMKLVSSSGLELAKPLMTGQWWGNNEGDGYGQDVLILRRKE